MLAGLGLNVSAFDFSGGVTGTTGPDSYRGSKLDLLLGFDSLVFEPSMASYTLGDTYRTYGLRVAKETPAYTAGAEAGTTPAVNAYSNTYFGADITFSLMPGAGGHSRLAGPGAHSYASGGEGITRIDIGASVKEVMHKDTAGTADLKTNQTQYSMFAGAKVMMINLAASYTGYNYGTDDFASLINPVPGLNFVYRAEPKASVNARIDLPGYPMVTPFVSYTGTKYKGGVKNSSAYLFGAYIDLKMVTADIGWQIFDNGSITDSFLTVGAGVKF